MIKKNISASDKSQSSVPSLRLSKETVKSLRVTSGCKTGRIVVAEASIDDCTNFRAW